MSKMVEIEASVVVHRTTEYKAPLEVPSNVGTEVLEMFVDSLSSVDFEYFFKVKRVDLSIKVTNSHIAELSGSDAKEARAAIQKEDEEGFAEGFRELGEVFTDWYDEYMRE